MGSPGMTDAKVFSCADKREFIGGCK
jgi:hypothetical protein